MFVQYLHIAEPKEALFMTSVGTLASHYAHKILKWYKDTMLSKKMFCTIFTHCCVTYLARRYLPQKFDVFIHYHNS